MNDNNQKENKYAYEEIDIKELIGIIWLEKRTIAKFVAAASILAVSLSLSMPNIYTSNAILAPTGGAENLNDSLRAYSGIASLAGISLPSSSNRNMSDEALKMLTTFSFFNESVLPDIFLPDLMAFESWDAKNNIVKYEDNIFNAKDQKWVRNVAFPKSIIPSPQEAFISFQESFSVFQEQETGFITLSIKHQSPNIARAWLDHIIISINQKLREDQKKRALISISYLNSQMANTNYTEIKQGLSQLIQQETEKLMLIEANEDYVFKVIDPPIAPELKSSPNRPLICIIGSLIGAILGLIFIFIKRFAFLK